MKETLYYDGEYSLVYENNMYVIYWGTSYCIFSYTDSLFSIEEILPTKEEWIGVSKIPYELIELAKNHAQNNKGDL